MKDNPRLFSLRFLAVCVVLSAIATAATPYAVLKMGMSVDLSTFGLFAIALMYAGARSQGDTAVRLNVFQSAVGVVQGMAFMVVILAAFKLIPEMSGQPDLALNLSWWQIAVWMFFSAGLGMFATIPWRKAVLNDRSLPWPTGKASVAVLRTLSDEESAGIAAENRKALWTGAGIGAFTGFLRDAIGVLPPVVGNAVVNLSVMVDFTGFGIGMFLPLVVGVSGLIGVWFIAAFGQHVALYSAMSGVDPANWDACVQAVAAGDETNAFLTQSCGHAAAYMHAVASGGSVWKYVIMWNMWPATAMMIAAALTGTVVAAVKNARNRRQGAQDEPFETLADERIPAWVVWAGMTFNTVGLVVVQNLWLHIPWYDVLLSVAIQPILIIAGVRIMAITGSGPVSLFGNAMQFIYGIFRPGEMVKNLAMAQVAADAQASGEGTAGAFWVARRVGGRYLDLLIVQLVVLPIGALLTPIFFQVMADTYGIGGDHGLSAPTAVKIAGMAVVMSKGLAGLPYGALTASVVAAVVGVGLELLRGIDRVGEDGTRTPRFGWIPVPASVGFAMILPSALTIALAGGSITAAAWRAFSKGENGSYALYATNLAAGLVAGESVMGGMLVPLLAEIAKRLLAL